MSDPYVLDFFGGGIGFDHLQVFQKEVLNLPDFFFDLQTNFLLFLFNHLGVPGLLCQRLLIFFLSGGSVSFAHLDCLFRTVGVFSHFQCGPVGGSYIFKIFPALLDANECPRIRLETVFHHFLNNGRFSFFQSTADKTGQKKRDKHNHEGSKAHSATMFQVH
ncbi:MAG TPA: hypothetical protein PLA90_17565 [Candidatus Sumerlaeota bacterium]|nr:hypothetical protein [Candidatus Sumerlaeota bacterium]